MGFKPIAMGDSGEQGIAGPPSSIGGTQPVTGGTQVSAGATLTTSGVLGSVVVAVAPSTLVGSAPHATIGKTDSQGIVTAEVSKLSIKDNTQFKPYMVNLR